MAKAVYMELSDEERERLLEESREKFRRDWASRMQGAREEGIAIGQKDGRKELLRLWEGGKSLEEAKRILGIE
jgi:hypothetical protein